MNRRHVVMVTYLIVVYAAIHSASIALSANFSEGQNRAVKFGVHEIVLMGESNVANPFDTISSVTFTPPSGAQFAKTVHTFFDGDGTWRARIYASEIGQWTWSATSATDRRLNGQNGTFNVAASHLRGRLLPHPQNARQWITEDGRWFLNINDTAYFLLCRQDGNGTPVSEDDVARYMRDDTARGITSIRCFLASQKGGFTESNQQWKDWYFEDATFDRLQLANLKSADRRLRWLLDEYPDIAVQLIMFPLEGYAQDDRFWTALTAKQRERLLRNLVARFAAFPQLFWLGTNDAHYSEKHPNSNAMAREVGRYLQQYDPWQHPRSTGHARRLPFYFGKEDWATYVHIEHAHDLGAQQYAVYHDLNKPVFLGEDRYEQDRVNLDPLHMRYWQRRLFWAWLLSGGSTNYGGRWWTVHPYSESGARPAIYNRRPENTFRQLLAGLDSVRFIRDFFQQRSVDLGEFEPDHALVEDLNGQNDADAPKLMRRHMDEFLIYHPNADGNERAANVNSTRTVRMRLDLRLATGQFNLEWYRAEDGQTQDGGKIFGGARQELTAPWSGADIVALLRQR